VLAVVSERAVWDATKKLRFGFAFSYRETNFIPLNDNLGCGFDRQTQRSSRSRPAPFAVDTCRHVGFDERLNDASIAKSYFRPTSQADSARSPLYLVARSRTALRGK